MSEMEILNITSKDLSKMTIKKYDDNDKPKIWISGNILYKRDIHNTIKRNKEDFEILNECEELVNCVFPKDIFFVDNKYVGYTTPYYENYKSINFRMYKNKYTINQKKKIMRKIVKLLMKLNKYDIVHADLNTSNVICNGKDVKLIDFDRIKVRENEDELIYNWRLKEQIYYLNIILFTVLLDVDLIRISNDEYKEFVDEMSFTNEFKQYLLNSSSSKQEEIPKELLEYIDDIKRKDIVNGKELVKALRL